MTVRLRPYGPVLPVRFWTTPDEDYNVRLWAKNLTNLHYVVAGNNYYFFGDTKAEYANPVNRDVDPALYGPPRTFGVTFDYHM